MQENLPSPGRDGQGNQRPDSISAGNPAQQSMNRPARQRDIKPAPYAAAADQRQHRPHRLNVSACNEIASGKPGEARSHPATGAGKARIFQKSATSQAQLCVRCQSVRAGLQSRRDHHQRKTTHPDKGAHDPRIGRRSGSVVAPRVDEGDGPFHNRLVYRTRGGR